ncbi:MAG: peptidyl-prolyl cis-trans isomerase, partial [Deltaproteobacteria bacterium]|nr:peptidyl-prolyl cis-trans isomerase [Deltaproteobacteria bacterium]
MTEKNISILQRFLREPLLHFIAIGSLFFLIYSAVNDIGENPTDTILITPERISQIATEFNRVWNRVPTAEELDNLIKEEVRSEVYYRDAL